VTRLLAAGLLIVGLAGCQSREARIGQALAECKKEATVTEERVVNPGSLFKRAVTKERVDYDKKTECMNAKSWYYHSEMRDG